MSKLHIFHLVLTVALLAVSLEATTDKKKPFPLSIIHINDFHDRFEEITPKAKPCQHSCIGGYARLVTVIKTLFKNASERKQNPLFLNGGDNFLGTTWYTLLRWNMTSSLLNLLPPDAMTLGNHEFDGQVQELAQFLDAFRAPVLVANMNVKSEPLLKNKLRKSLVLERGGRKIGIIGVIYDKTNLIAATGRVKFTDSSAAVNLEAQKLKKQGVEIIIVISHCGFNIDLLMAEKADSLVDVIVGAHTHTFLYNGSSPSPDKPEETYPVVVETENHKTLVVQANAYGKFVGNLLVNFDSEGEIISWQGNPVYVSQSYAKDKVVEKKLKSWRKKVLTLTNRLIATSTIHWSRDSCRMDECEIGLLVADSMVDYYKKSGNGPLIGFLHGGGIRTELGAGNVTFGDLIQVVPYSNTVDLFELQGQYLRKALEHSAIFDADEQKYNFLQPSGFKYVVNLQNEESQRIESVEVINDKGEFVPLDDKKVYKIVTTSYLLGGNDGFKMLKENKKKHHVGKLDIDVLVEYVQKLKTLTGTNKHRIMIKNKSM